MEALLVKYVIYEKIERRNPNQSRLLVYVPGPTNQSEHFFMARLFPIQKNWQLRHRDSIEALQHIQSGGGLAPLEKCCSPEQFA